MNDGCSPQALLANIDLIEVNVGKYTSQMERMRPQSLINT